MGILDRISTSIESAAHSILGDIEDPGEILDLQYTKSVEELTKVKASIATMVTQRKLLEEMRMDLSSKVAKLDTQASTSLQNGDEATAIKLLERKQALVTSINDLNPQIKDFKTNERNMIEKKDQLETNLCNLEIQKETLKARLQAADAQNKVNETMGGLSSKIDVTDVVNRANERINQSNARAGAIDELLTEGVIGSGDTLTTRVASMESDAAVKNDLARLKASIKK
jgi:phage shock protein A